MPGREYELIKCELHSLLSGIPPKLKHFFMRQGINSTVTRLIHSDAHENSDSEHGKAIIKVSGIV
jgi:hypothetical protein